MEEQGAVLLEMAGTPHSYSSYNKLIPHKIVCREDLFSSSSEDTVKVHILRENILVSWREGILENLCIGSNLETFKNIHSMTHYNTSDYYVASFNSPIADLKTGSVFLNSSTAWADSCFAGILHGPVHLSPAIEARGDERWFWRTKADIKHIELSAPAMTFCHWGSLTNYGHWLANAIVAAYLVLPELQARKIFLVGPKLSDRQKRELLMIGVPNSQIIETDAQYISAPRIIYSSASSTVGNMMPSPVCMEVMQSLKEQISVQLDQASHEYIYVSRKGASHSRIMRNEDQLIEALKKLGITTIYPHELGFDAQVKAFSAAKIIIGQLGAALWSMPFAPRGGAFVEISTSNYASNEYVSIANLMGRKFVQIMVEPTNKGGTNDVVLSFDAPICDIIDIVEKLI